MIDIRSMESDDYSCVPTKTNSWDRIICFLPILGKDQMLSTLLHSRFSLSLTYNSGVIEGGAENC